MKYVCALLLVCSEDAPSNESDPSPDDIVSSETGMSDVDDDMQDVEPDDEPATARPRLDSDVCFTCCCAP